MKKDYILKIFVVVLNLIIIIRVFNVAILNHQLYQEKKREIVDSYVYGSTPPRGRFLDSKGRVLVDNKGIKALMYKKTSSVDEVDLAHRLADILDITGYDVSESDKLDYYYHSHKAEIDSNLDEKVVDKYNSKQISKKEFLEYKYSFIKQEQIDDIDLKEVYIYKLMNTGYMALDKVIKNDLSEEELFKINSLNSKALMIKIKWVRTYNYDTILNELFGSIGSIPKEEVNSYLSNGYKLDDVVGVSFLEKYYEKYLHGDKALYKLQEDGRMELISEEKRGNDLVLGIDIETQMEIESVLKEEIINVKKYPSSQYYNGSYVVVSEPKTGAIKALVGYNYKDDFASDVIGLLTNSYTVGSIVKGASQSVAYINGVINEDEYINDDCVKLLNMPSKCSWKRLGRLNDIDALTYSSNYYQFINAIKVAGAKYYYNMNFKPTIDDFNKYRSVFKEYGLGALSGIDLYEEKLGITGSRISGDLLLNYTIGQYDTYTPLMITSYINTIANNGGREKLRIVDYGLDNEGNKVIVNDSEVLNQVGIKEEHLKRVQTGLRNVILRGTAGGYVNGNYKAAGKTGTSETFFDGNSTTTKSFVMYAPFEEPEYSVVIISPHLVHKNDVNNYSYPVNSRLSKKITNILFDN